MSLLQELELEPLEYHRVDSEHIQQTLAITSQLRGLTLHCYFDQAQFGLLLTHGTQLTRLNSRQPLPDRGPVTVSLQLEGADDS
jgi:hypothetical protein